MHNSSSHIAKIDMYRLMIADDEPKIRRRIATILDWDKLDIEIVSQAEDGQQAISFLSKQKIDLAIIDINMPFINGIELIEKINEISPKTLCIILTGYAEFAYAQRSVELGVFDYLLKPVKKEIILTAIERALAKIKTRDIIRIQLDRAMELLNNRIVSLRQGFLLELLSGVLSEEEISIQTSLLDMSSDSGYGLILMAFDPIASDHIHQDGRNLALFNLLLQDNLVSNIESDTIAVFDKCENLIMLSLCEISSSATDRLARLRSGLYSTIGHEPTALDYYDLSQISEATDLYSNWLEKMKSSNSPLIQKMKRYIDKNFSNSKLNLTSISSEFHLSSGYASRLFRQNTGMTFIEYLIHVRIRHSVRLLERTNMQIWEIADRTGYSSQHYFCTAFKKILGVAPTEYRDMKGSNDEIN